MDIYLLLRYFACKTTPEEERHVREWILDDKDGSRAELYRDTHIIYQGMVLHSEGQMTPAATPPPEFTDRGGNQSGQGFLKSRR